MSDDGTVTDSSGSLNDSSGGDSVTETSTQSWGSRLGDSLKSVLIGLALVAVSCVALFWNEGRAVQTARSLAEGSGLVESVDTGSVDPAREGHLIHVTGPVATTAPLSDPDFLVSATAVRLVRKAEMFQWKEDKHTEKRKNLGGSEETVTTYSYERAWQTGRVDSARFHQQTGHINPPARYTGRSVVATDATLGAFRPGTNVLDHIVAKDQLPVEQSALEALRARIQGGVEVVGGMIFLGANASSPQVGDQRISYMLARPETISVIGRQSGSGFDTYQTKAGDRLLMVEEDSVSAADMFRSAASMNKIVTWIIRLVGVVLMFVGWAMIFSPLVVVADVVPLIGDVLGVGAGLVAGLLTAVLAPLIIAIAWFWYRPLVAVIILGVGLALAVGFKLVGSRMAPTPAPGPLPAPAR